MVAVLCREPARCKSLLQRVGLLLKRNQAGYFLSAACRHLLPNHGWSLGLDVYSQCETCSCWSLEALNDGPRLALCSLIWEDDSVRLLQVSPEGEPVISVPQLDGAGDGFVPIYTQVCQGQDGVVF